MSGYLWLAGEQMERLWPFLAKSRGEPRVEDRRVLRGVIHVRKDGLQGKDAPADYGPPRTLNDRFVRRSRKGVFAHISADLAQPGPDGDTILIPSCLVDFLLLPALLPEACPDFTSRVGHHGWAACPGLLRPAPAP